MRKYGKSVDVKLDPLKYNIAILGESGIGKEQPVSEPVLTEKGWVSMGDIQVGDRVFGENGKSYTVTGVFPQGEKDVYEVSFWDGTKTRCGLNHLWNVTFKGRKTRSNPEGLYTAVLPLEEIMKDYRKEIPVEEGSEKTRPIYRYSIPINQAVEFTELDDRNLYIKGLQIGGGAMSESPFAFSTTNQEAIEQWISYCRENQVSYQIDKTGMRFSCHYTNAPMSADTSLDEVTPWFDKVSLVDFNEQGEKIISDDDLYHIGVFSRRSLLRGILNAGGYAHRGSLHFTTLFASLRDSVTELARGLGFIAQKYQYTRRLENEDAPDEEIPVYGISIMGSDLDSLSLSDSISSKCNNRPYVKFITNIQPVGTEQCQCIMVDNPNHMYLTKDYIVTHNTTLAKEVCEKLAGPDGYIHFDIGREYGADAIQGIVSERMETWQKITDVVDDIVENKTTDYPDLKVVIWDTCDEWVDLAEKETLRQYNQKHTDQKADTINGAWGGFGKGQDKAIDMMMDKIAELKSVGVSSILIFHIKRAETVDALSQEAYSKLTADVQQRYFNAFKAKMHFIAMCYIDREIIKQSTGRKNIVTKDDITYQKVTEERRMISFRDDNYTIDSKSRFADIVDKIPFSSDLFIQALKDAILAEQAKGKKSLEQTKKEQEAEAAAEQEQFAAYSKQKREARDIDPERNQELLERIKNKSESVSAEQWNHMLGLLHANGLENFKNPDKIPTSLMEELVALIDA